MKWLKLLILLCVITAVVSSMHGRTYYEKLRTKNGRNFQQSNEKNTFSEIENQMNSDEFCPEKIPQIGTDGNNIFEDKFLLTNVPHEGPEHGINRAKILAANRARESVTCAEAQLREKQFQFDQIMRGICDINSSINETKESGYTLKDSMDKIMKSRFQAIDLFKHLYDSLKQTKVVNRRMQKTTEIVRDGLLEKLQSMENAKKRVQDLLCQLKQATQDFEQTQQAASKASDSAKKAQSSANPCRWRRRPVHRNSYLTERDHRVHNRRRTTPAAKRRNNRKRYYYNSTSKKKK